MVETEEEPKIVVSGETGKMGSGRLCVKLRIPKDSNKCNGRGGSSETEAADDQFPECALCGKRFRSVKALGGHMRIHTGEERERLKKQCLERAERELSFKDGLVSSISLQEEKPPPCVVCQRRFPSLKSLYGHMRSHPDRKWRGIQPQTAVEKKEPDNTPPRTVLAGWSVTGKRGMRSIASVNSGSSSGFENTGSSKHKNRQKEKDGLEFENTGSCSGFENTGFENTGSSKPEKGQEEKDRLGFVNTGFCLGFEKAGSSKHEKGQEEKDHLGIVNAGSCLGFVNAGSRSGFKNTGWSKNEKGKEEKDCLGFVNAGSCSGFNYACWSKHENGQEEDHWGFVNTGLCLGFENAGSSKHKKGQEEKDGFCCFMILSNGESSATRSRSDEEVSVAEEAGKTRKYMRVAADAKLTPGRHPHDLKVEEAGNNNSCGGLDNKKLKKRVIIKRKVRELNEANGNRRAKRATKDVCDRAPTDNKHTCNTRNKSFSSHQVLGGRRSSCNESQQSTGNAVGENGPQSQSLQPPRMFLGLTLGLPGMDAGKTESGRRWLDFELNEPPLMEEFENKAKTTTIIIGSTLH